MPTSTAPWKRLLPAPDARVAAVDKALADPAVKGIVVTSAKKTFFAGGNLKNPVLAANGIRRKESGAFHRTRQRGGDSIVDARFTFPIVLI